MMNKKVIMMLVILLTMTMTNLNQIPQGNVIIKQQGSIEMVEQPTDYLLEKKMISSKSMTLSRGSTTPKYKTVTMIITGYCPCKLCSGKHGRNTASGIKASHGVVAVPKDIPFGSIIAIENFEGNALFTAVAGDRGGAIKRIDGNTIKVDVFYNTHEEAKNIKEIRKGYIIIKE